MHSNFTRKIGSELYADNFLNKGNLNKSSRINFR